MPTNNKIREDTVQQIKKILKNAPMDINELTGQLFVFNGWRRQTNRDIILDMKWANQLNLDSYTGKVSLRKI